MSKLHVVSVTVGAEGSAQSQSSRVVGAYTDPIVADCVKQVAWGDGAVVTEVEVDFIDPELRKAMYELGVELPAQGYGGGRVENAISPYSRPLPMGTKTFTVEQGPEDLDRLRTAYEAAPQLHPGKTI